MCYNYNMDKEIFEALLDDISDEDWNIFHDHSNLIHAVKQDKSIVIIEGLIGASIDHPEYNDYKVKLSWRQQWHLLRHIRRTIVKKAEQQVRDAILLTAVQIAKYRMKNESK